MDASTHKPTTTFWRALLVGLCAIVALLAAAQIYSQFGGPHGTALVGQWGDTVAVSSRPYHLKILSVDPGHGADRAGLRPGDLLDLRANTPAERFWLFGQPPTGWPVSVAARRGDREIRATILPETTTPLRRLLITPISFGFLWIALFAGTIAWRRSDDPQMRMLALMLATYALWETTNQHFVSAPWAWVLAAFAGANALGMLCVPFWAACAGTFAPPRSRARRVAQAVCYVLVAAAIGIVFLRVLGIATLAFDPTIFSQSVTAAPFVLGLLAAAACTILAVRACEPGADRQRALWSLVPAALLIIVGFGAEALQGVVTSYDAAWTLYYVASAINVAVPMVLTYVALSRRLLDIGFVLNRAAVFAILSSMLIGAFVIAEWFANEALSLNHRTSAIVGMAVALAIGLSMHRVHEFADALVDNVFFRRRHEAEAALRRFAHEAAFVTDANVLIERTLAVVRASTDADASVLLLDGDTAGIDENDPALVAMRAWHKPVDIEALPASALGGQFAFPMVARGRLLGAIVCGSKQNNEVYAPDEYEALTRLADGVGHALGLLSTQGEDRALRDAVRELREAIGELRTLRT